MVLRMYKFESPSLKNALCQVCLKLVQRFWKRRFLNVCNQFFLLLSPLRKGFGPSFEQIYITITHCSFVPSLVEIGPVVLWKIFLSHQCNFTMLLSSPLIKGCGPSFEQTWIPITQGCKFGWISVILKRKTKMWKGYKDNSAEDK